MTEMNWNGFTKTEPIFAASVAPPQNVLVSFSGGRSSALMCAMMKRGEAWSRHNLKFVFSNTGREFPETLDFVHECDKAMGLNLSWVEARVNPERGEVTTHTTVAYQSAARDGQPFEAVIQKYGLSNMAYPHCTRELKLRPITSWAKEVFNGQKYLSAIGIRFDEIRRVNKRNPSYIYPLADNGVNVDDVRRFWNRQSFNLKLKDYEGNCDLCWKKSIRKQMTIVQERPGVSKWWSEMESRYATTSVTDGTPRTFFRKNLSAADIVTMAQLPFEKAVDKYFGDPDEEQACACMNSDFEGEE